MAAGDLGHHEVETVDCVPDRLGVLELEAGLGLLLGGHFEFTRGLVVNSHEARAARFAKILVAPCVHARRHAESRDNRGDAENHTDGLQHRAAQVFADLDESLADELGGIHAAACCPFGRTRPSTIRMVLRARAAIEGSWVTMIRV